MNWFAVARMLTVSAVLLCLSAMVAPRAAAKWRYTRTGSPTDVAVAPRTGYALMGGGAKQDPAFHFLCERTNGGDFLILRANTDDEYAQGVNKEIFAMCPLNSAATIVFEEREDSDDPTVAQIIDHAEGLFIAGGDQSNYLRFWQDSPVQAALNRHIAAGKPIGGSSAGLAVLGEFSFAAMIDTIHSPEALADPYGNKITISRGFLMIPLLQGIITDTHFAKRDRMGRLLVFMARILQDDWAKQVRAIAVEENVAFLLEPDGTGKVVGEGSTYFLEAKHPPEICKRNEPLKFDGISVRRVGDKGTFNVKTWSGNDGDTYSLSTQGGKVTPAGSDHGIY
jgi:cyanophycinase